MEILWRWSPKISQWYRQKRQTKTSQVKTTLVCQPNIEKCRIGRNPQRIKSKKQCFQRLLWKDDKKWCNYKQCPTRSSTKAIDRDVGHVENKQSVRWKFTPNWIDHNNSINFVEVTLMVSRLLSGSEFLLRHWTCFIHSPHYLNEPEPLLLCLNNLHGLPDR